VVVRLTFLFCITGKSRPDSDFVGGPLFCTLLWLAEKAITNGDWSMEMMISIITPHLKNFPLNPANVREFSTTRNDNAVLFAC
jgi:hypothetical protein